MMSRKRGLAVPDIWSKATSVIVFSSIAGMHARKHSTCQSKMPRWTLYGAIRCLVAQAILRLDRSEVECPGTLTIGRPGFDFQSQPR
jgi:hypothetical protein